MSKISRPLRQIYHMKVKSIRDLTPTVRELLIRSDAEPFQFRAGQFVMLHVPQTETKPALRAYSIASSSHSENEFRLLFKYVETGKASEFVWSLQGDEDLQFTGPFGKVFFQEPPTEQIIFLNTGTGLAQHLSYLETNLDILLSKDSRAEAYTGIKYKMFFGVRSETDMYFTQELESLKKYLPHFDYEFVLSRPSESWQGKKGYVQNYISSLSFMEIPTTFYLCGNGGMIKETKAILHSHQFPAERICAEAFD